MELKEQVEEFISSLGEKLKVDSVYSNGQIVEANNSNISVLFISPRSNPMTDHVSLIIKTGSFLCTVMLYSSGYVVQPVSSDVERMNFPYDIGEDAFFQKSLVQDFGYLEYSHIEMLRNWLDFMYNGGKHVQKDY